MVTIPTLIALMAIHGALKKDKNDPSTQKEPPTSVEQSVSAPTMQGIALVGSESRISQIDKSTMKGGLYVDSSIVLPGSQEELEKKLASLVFNQSLNRNNLLAVKNAILSYYTAHDERMVAVEIPEQEVTGGIVAIIITQAKVGEVTYRGNKWLSTRRIERKLNLRKGNALNEDAALNNISWLNQNPFHHTEAILSPGKSKNSSDVEVVTKDRFPLRFYTGGDNTGVESTGRGRLYAGAMWGNAFFMDDLLSYQFTSNIHYNKFHSHSANYTSFLPWKHTLMLYGGYTEIHPDIKNFHQDKKEAQGSLRYKIPFKPLYTRFLHQLYGGFDYKYVTSALFFVSNLSKIKHSDTAVNISQGMLGYQLEYTPSHHDLSLRAEVFGSAMAWLPHQSKHDFSSFRRHALPEYLYGTIAIGDVYTFSSKDSISALFRAQGATGALIPSEQFALGGYNTVRGYEESVFISDNGICANLEVRARPLHLVKGYGGDQLTFLAFMDFGWGYNFYAFDGITKTARLWGIGPGLRYTINPYLNIRVDYGFKLHHVTFDKQSPGMWHVGATLSY